VFSICLTFHTDVYNFAAFIFIRIDLNRRERTNNGNCEENDVTLDPQEYVNLLPEVQALVNKVVQKNMADAMLFSAGTDFCQKFEP